MKRLCFFIIFNFIALPILTLAHPGPVDQYGGHICQDNCEKWSVEKGAYHYHAFPSSPAYLSGYMEKNKNLSNYIFYQPYVPPIERTMMQQSLISGELNELTKNIDIDARFCNYEMVFGQGLYDELNRARIKPVCATAEDRINSLINKPESSNYYKDIPDPKSKEITMVYHFYDYNNKKIFTDKPRLEELKGKIIQGATDPNLYYVNRYDNPLVLRPIKASKAKFFYGDDYQDSIVYFDDSIIYSYKIGHPLY